MKKFGVLVKSLGASQLNYLVIKRVNEIVASRPDVHFTAFYEALARPCIPLLFSAMQTAECFGYDADLAIATTFSTAAKLALMPGPKKKVFLIWDLEWLRPENRKTFREMQTVYGDPELTLWARGQDHADVISQIWNRHVEVVGDSILPV